VRRDTDLRTREPSCNLSATFHQPRKTLGGIDEAALPFDGRRTAKA